MANADKPKAAAIYCRLSYAPDGSLEKVERQEADCRALAKVLGWSVRQVYPDNSRSAWQRNRKRPQWNKMLDDIEHGQVDGIIVYHGDRLIRQPWDLELLLKLGEDRHIPLASPSGTRDLSNEDDRFILRVEAAQACRSSADTSRRVKRGWKARAEDGRPIGGGKRPFGWGVATDRVGKSGKTIYDTTVPVPGEAAVLVDAYDRLLAGQTQGGVIAWMNTVSTTTQGGRWVSRNFKQVMLAPRNAGLIEHDGRLLKAQWDGIVTPETWEAVKFLLEQNSETYGYAGRDRRYLLSGIAECVNCGAFMTTKPSGGRNRKDSRLYHCKNPDCTGRVSRNVEHLDAYVKGRVLRRLNEPAFIAAIHTDDKQPTLGAEITKLQLRKTEAKATLEELADHPDVDPALLVKSLASFDRKIKQLRDQMATTSRQRLLARMAGITEEQWDAEPIDVRAETVRALFRVVILPVTKRGPGFDPEAVSVTRRDEGRTA